MTRILGIDPGSRFTGYAVIEQESNRLIHLASGRLEVAKLGELPDRLLAIFRGLKEVIDQTKPEVCSMEKIFHSVNAQSSLVLGHARGVAMLAAKEAGLEIFEYAPTEIKNAVVGQGRAPKSQVAQMVTILLNLDRRIPLAEDQSDALAIAICHANSHQMKTLKRS